MKDDEMNIIGKYVTFCKNSKIHQVSKLTVDPREEGGIPKVMGMDTFLYSDTAIRRIRRFIKYLGLNLDYAVIPRAFSHWEDSFSLWNDVKYSTSLNERDTELNPTCRFYVEGKEIASMTRFLSGVVTVIDLNGLEELLD